MLSSGQTKLLTDYAITLRGITSFVRQLNIAIRMLTTTTQRKDVIQRFHTNRDYGATYTTPVFIPTNDFL